MPRLLKISCNKLQGIEASQDFVEKASVIEGGVVVTDVVSGCINGVGTAKRDLCESGVKFLPQMKTDKRR